MLSNEQIIKIAKENETPMYLFDLDELQSRVKKMKEILGENVNICYAMKANPFLLDSMKTVVDKFEVCSPGEFAICEREKINMESIVLSGVNKEKRDIEHVFDDCGGVGIFTIESRRQLELLAECAKKRKKKIEVIVRLTSGNQFGVDKEELEDIIKNKASYEYVNFKGIQCYSGTQKKKMSQIEKEIKWLDEICDELFEKYGWKAEEFEYGPGLLISYFGDDAFDDGMNELKEFSGYLDSVREKYEITLEMGRFIAATCGKFISAIADLKTNNNQNYCIIDGGINHINYYGQTMAMKIPAYTFVKEDGTIKSGYDMVKKEYISNGDEEEKWTICGSLCTVADVIVKNLPISKPQLGDMIIFHNIGAYSVTEGIYLFLSRRMPLIAAYSEKKGLEIYRKTRPSDEINSRMQVLF